MNVAALRSFVLDAPDVETALGRASRRVRSVLERALAGRRPSVEEIEVLLGTEGEDLRALLRVADEIRATDVGPEVTYVVNRNINFTNVCFVGCQFCAFARHRRDPDARTDSLERVLEKVAEAVDRGATEICMQGGINPDLDPYHYRDLLVAIKRRFPRIHIHAFSPMEILYGARRTGLSFRDYLAMLREAGLDTIPGTAAEILDDEVREILSHKKVDVRTWVEIVTTAHELGIPSTSTIMYGHIETPAHVARHLDLLRRIQERTGGFTELVPLRFIHTYTALYQKGLVDPPPKGLVDLRMYGVCRVAMRGLVQNLQTSWVKLGIPLAQLSLAAGCNDFGGTLMEEQISKSAGADAGEYLPEEEIRKLVAEMGRIPVQRTTTYGRIERPSEDRSAGRGGRSSAVLEGALFAR
ncbi:MAG: 7,8-didemethyl-8-hydroxy-5-deazariboflavin synthase subunit CofH [Candidatus Binatia bacterium]|nr:MAG: 7,8-didemethyl-8-hydroxy-5-deazariboflavin synthase subunit CofH [Candidatus Binatia bacterium]